MKKINTIKDKYYAKYDLHNGTVQYLAYRNKILSKLIQYNKNLCEVGLFNLKVEYIRKLSEYFINWIEYTAIFLLYLWKSTGLDLIKQSFDKIMSIINQANI